MPAGKGKVKRIRFAASNVRVLRQRLGDSQMQFAVRLGVAERTVRRWELPVGHPQHRDPHHMTSLLLTELWQQAQKAPQETTP